MFEANYFDNFAAFLKQFGFWEAMQIPSTDQCDLS
jgi:hypothetical protein